MTAPVTPPVAPQDGSPDPWDDLLRRLLAGEVPALARAITLAEAGGEGARRLIAAVYGRTGRAHVVGVTGPPGAGKSSLIDRLAAAWRAAGKTVAVIAVDPSSPFTGGAILGDRVRMAAGARDPGVYIRSLANRGHLGGLSAAARDAALLCDAAGRDVVLLETVGAGQAEVEVMSVAGSVVVVLAPGMGDEVQALKAGVLEIGDVFVVNKADRDGADRTVAELRFMLHLGMETRAQPQTVDPAAQAPGAWEPPVLKTVATAGEGIDALVEALDRHRAHLASSPEGAARRRRQAAEVVRALVTEAFLDRALAAARADGLLERVVDAVARRETDPHAAAGAILARVLDGRGPREQSPEEEAPP